MITATIGRDMILDQKVKISGDSYNQSILILGTSGSGKSFAAKCIEQKLAEDGAAVLVMNFNETHSDVRGTFVRWIHVREQGFPFGLFDKNNSQERNAQEALKIFEGVEKLFTRQKRSLRMALLMATKICKDQGEDFLIIRRCLGRIAIEEEALADSCEALLDRFFEVFHDVRINAAEVIIPGKITILDYSGYDGSTQRMLTEFALSALWRDAKNNGIGNRIPVYVVLDEFQNLNCCPGGVLESVLREGRKFQCHLMLITQSLSTFPREIRPIFQLPATRLLFPLVEKDSREILQSLPFPRADSEKLLRSLSKGLCIGVGRLEMEDTIVEKPLVLTFCKEEKNGQK
mgnify:CR=1 FL=1